ncbi:hypothetical protein BJ170DRAFT_644088, partial [Xylariales sp. AK1849]
MLFNSPCIASLTLVGSLPLYLSNSCSSPTTFRARCLNRFLRFFTSRRCARIFAGRCAFVAAVPSVHTRLAMPTKIVLVVVWRVRDHH